VARPGQERGQFSLEGTMSCSGLLLADPTGADRALFLTADHCGVREENADTVVVYWSFQSPACGQRGGGTADQFQGGATIRHRSAANDLAILELEVEVTATGAGPWSIPIRTTAGTAGGTPLPISMRPITASFPEPQAREPRRSSLNTAAP
jgi:hypothetical protein